MPLQVEKDNHIMIHDNDSEVVKHHNAHRSEGYIPFKVDPVDKIVKTIMTSRLEDTSYDPSESVQVCQSIATEIREKIKSLKFDRYKIIVNVTIIEKANQSIESSAGFLWDAERDNYSTFTYEARTFHAYCCVFGLYYE